MKRKRKVKRKPLIILVLLLMLVGGGYLFINYLNGKKKTETRYLASSELKVSLKNEEGNAKEVSRGTKVDYYINQDEDNKAKIKLNDEEYYLDKKYLVNDIKETVLEKELYVRTSYNINKDLETTDLLTLAKKGDKLEIIGFDKLDDDGKVNMYKVKYNDTEGYFYEKYTEKTEELAKVNYDFNGAYETHKKQKDVYGGGNGASLDYFPVVKP